VRCMIRLLSSFEEVLLTMVKVIPTSRRWKVNENMGGDEMKAKNLEIQRRNLQWSWGKEQVKHIEYEQYWKGSNLDSRFFPSLWPVYIF